MKLTWLQIFLYSLAVFRLSLMLSEDAGPWKMFTKLRSWLKREQKKSPALKKSDVAVGIECKRCTSVWVAGPVAVYAASREQLLNSVVVVSDTFILCMALSAGAILWNRAFPKR